MNKKIYSPDITLPAVIKMLVLPFFVPLSMTLLLFFDAHSQATLLADIDESEELTHNEYSSLTSGEGRVFFIGHDTELWTSGLGGDDTQDTRLLHRFTSISDLTLVGSILYFIGDDGVNGGEIWKSDGTETGTAMVKDIRPGESGSTPQGLTDVNGTLYFSANDGKTGKEVWKSDGTSAGTVLVKDIMRISGSSNPASLTNVNGALFFAANDGSIGYELWKSDGTEKGTVVVKDIRTGTRLSSSPDEFVNVNGILFFVASDATAGRELWKSDGTAAGTMRVKDIRPGTRASRIDNGTAVNGSLFFTATDGVHGHELWKSDGNEAGTTLVKDMTPGPEGSHGETSFSHQMGNFTNIAGTLFYTGYQKETYYIWKSDGTSAGTIPLVECFGPGIYQPIPNFTLFKDRIYYFNATDNSIDGEFLSMNLHGTDHQFVMGFSQEDSYNTYYPDLAVANDHIYISGRPDPFFGFKIVKTDGTPAGTLWLHDISTVTEGSYPSEPVHFNGRVYFKANDSFYQQHNLWVTDGTPAGTNMVFGYDQEIGEMELADNKLFASGESTFDIYKTDLSTGISENVISDHNKGPAYFLTNVNGTLFFTNAEGELWKTDGTVSGTKLLEDFHRITAMHAVEGKVMFRVVHEDFTEELWRSTGTPTGTIKLKTLHAGRAQPAFHYPAATIGNTYYFVANDGVHGNELWRSRGTPASTMMVIDLNTQESLTDQFESDIRHFVVFQNMLYFSARGDNGIWALYKTSGSDYGTHKVADMNYPVVHSAAGADQLFLFGHDNSTVHANAFLWVTDGTTDGTQMIKDLNSFAKEFSHDFVDDVLYFSIRYDRTLWRSDGTPCGTFDFEIGSHGAGSLAAVNSILIFASYDKQAGNEPHAFNTAEVSEHPCYDAMAKTLEDEGFLVHNEKMSAGYPNPFTAEITLRIAGPEQSMSHVRVFTLNGLPVEDMGELPSNHDHPAGQSWAPGLYVLHVTQGDKLMRYMLVKR